MEKIKYPDLFSSFVGREAELRRVIRYHSYQPMWYRSHLFTHSKRVLWLLQEILPLVETVFGAEFDVRKAQLLAVVHDDPEIVMGDIQAGHKRKMSPEQLAEVERMEQAAVKTMSERFPYLVEGYRYGDLLLESQEIKTIEAKLLKFVDRFDAFGEALHEIHAGNRVFTTHVIDPELGKIDLPTDFYQRYLPEFPEKNPEFKTLFALPNPMFQVAANFPIDKTVADGRQHSLASLASNTGCVPYELWKQVILASGDAEEIANLYIPTER